MALSLSKVQKVAAIVGVCASVIVWPTGKVIKWYIERSTDDRIGQKIEARVVPVEASLKDHVTSGNHPTEREITELRAEIAGARTDMQKTREDVAYIRGVLDRALRQQRQVTP